MEIQKTRLSRFCMSLSAMAMLSVFSTAQADSSILPQPPNSQQVLWVITGMEQLQ